jgi:hypothetical protein
MLELAYPKGNSVSRDCASCNAGIGGPKGNPYAGRLPMEAFVEEPARISVLVHAMMRRMRIGLRDALHRAGATTHAGVVA